ncbi:MAG: methyl-accepting chemotaxis protein [Solirubrobacterales bacterium]
MLAFLEDMPIGRRIALAFVLPVLGLIAFSGYVIVERWLVVSDTRNLITLAGLASEVGSVVHELQKERGASSLYLASKGSQFGDRLADQRKLTDKAAARLADAMEEAHVGVGALQGALAEARKSVEGRSATRKRVDDQAIDSKTAMGEYTGIIKTMLDLVARVALATPEKSTAELASSYLSFIEGKERAGQERATGSAGFAGGFDPALYRRFISLQAQQETLFGQFARQAPAQLASLFQQKSAEAPFAEVAGMREAAVAKVSGSGEGVPASAWFDATTRRINLLKEVEDAVTAQLSATATGVYERARLLLTLQIVAVIFGLGITFLVAVVVARGLNRPIVRMTETMTRLAGGDTSLQIHGLTLQNEFGDMARAVEVFRSNRLEADRLGAAEHANEAAKERRRLVVEELTRAFEREASAALAAVGTASEELKKTALQLDSGAKRMADHSNAVSVAASETSSNVQSVASAAEELAASIAEIGRRAAESANVSREAVDEAHRTNTLVSGLADAAHSIGEVVELISSIASQTNLLALNATIEAARAGDAGKGFAVVANEVKSLANETAKATDQISSQVGTVQQATREAVQAIEGIGVTIARISEIASAIAAAVEQQDATTRDIARNAQEAAGGTVEVSRHVHDVTGEAAETGTTADRVLRAADGLADQSASLRTSVEKFLRGVEVA